MISKLTHGYKYVTIGEEDKRWGIYITGAGHVHIEKHMEYPLVDDPSHHYFHWSTGRRLSEFQIIYISKGHGVFESESTGLKKINAGDIFILFPDVWHRFKPEFSVGWDEYWVEFDGDYIQQIHSREAFKIENPIFSIGLQADIVDNFQKILNMINEERPGFQFIASGILIQILGNILASKKYQSFEGKLIENQIREAKLIILENLDTTISQEDIAKKMGIGYSLYRKKFKEYTGISPAQYQINMRINKAKDLLITSRQSIKEIANNLGFKSTDYFFRLFKQKTGFTPSDFREKNLR